MATKPVREQKPLNEKERIEMLSREEKNRAAYAAVKDALQLIDLTNSTSKFSQPKYFANSRFLFTT